MPEYGVSEPTAPDAHFGLVRLVAEQAEDAVEVYNQLGSVEDQVQDAIKYLQRISDQQRQERESDTELVDEFSRSIHKAEEGMALDSERWTEEIARQTNRLDIMKARGQAMTYEAEELQGI